MKKILVLFILISAIVTGCTNTNVSKTKVDYIYKHGNKQGIDPYRPYRLIGNYFTEKQMTLFNQFDDTTILPFYCLDGSNMHAEDVVKDKNLFDVYKNDTLILKESQLTMKFEYQIYPYFGDEVNQFLKYEYLGENTEQLPEIYVSRTLVENLKIDINEDFNNKYVIDYYIKCPTHYDKEKASLGLQNYDYNPFGYEVIQIKAIVAGVVESKSGHGDAFMEHEELYKIINEHRKDEYIPTDTFVLINGTEKNKKEIINENKSLEIEKREW